MRAHILRDSRIAKRRRDHYLSRLPRESSMIKTIEIDCAPGETRPGDLIGLVVQGTILENSPQAAPDATVGRFFGCWTWSFPNVTDDEWKQIQEITKPRIQQLHFEGTIRYGSW